MAISNLQLEPMGHNVEIDVIFFISASRNVILSAFVHGGLHGKFPKNIKYGVGTSDFGKFGAN